MRATLRLPLEVTTKGALRTFEQDSTAEIAQSVRSLLSTVRGERGALPSYGLIDQLGVVEIDAGDIAQTIADWEPRVTEPTVSTLATRLADGAALTTVTVILEGNTP